MTGTTVAKQEAVKKEAKQDIYYQFDEYIKTKERKVSKARLTVCGNVKAHLQAFEKYRQEKISFASFDFNFYHGFTDYLTYEHVHMRRYTGRTDQKISGHKSQRIFISTSAFHRKRQLIRLRSCG